VTFAALSADVAGAALRAVIDVADEALEVGRSEDGLLARAAGGITAVLGDKCTIWLGPVAPGDPPAVASNHPDAVRAYIEDHFGTRLPEAPGRQLVGEPAGAWLSAYGLAECVVAPVLIRGQAIGMLVSTRSAGEAALNEVELCFVAAMADILGIAVQSFRVRNDTMVTLEELRQQAELTEHISDAVIACDSAYLIVGWNSGAEQIYGYTREDAIGCHLFTLLATEFIGAEDGEPVDPARVMADLADTRHWRGELRERRADGQPLVTLAAFTQLVDVRQQPSGLVALSRDVTAQRREEHQATHDVLTGLPNRRLLTTRLYDAAARADRTNLPLAIIFIDLDGFKLINDTYGHSAGDLVLTTVAERLRGAVRSRDTVGRLGGDEFLVIIEEAGGWREISGAVNRISGALNEPIKIEGYVVSVPPSVGVCIRSSAGRDAPPAEHLLDLADRAMYAAKRQRLGVQYVDAPADGCPHLGR
jgi:diguanylate cyclase (GGDEF)-like protein/PAS domain S-box-containing protein